MLWFMRLLNSHSHIIHLKRADCVFNICFRMKRDMKRVTTGMVLAMAFATAAHAGEARIEARGGGYWEQGASTNGPVTLADATAGMALGYDAEIGGPAFVGVEISGDKALGARFNRVSFALAGRIGAGLSPDDKIYAVGGYALKNCRLCKDGGLLGAGYQHEFGGLYGKVEYRRLLTGGGAVDGNSVMAGLGIHF